MSGAQQGGPLGLVTASPLGQALAARLRADGREVACADGTDGAALAEVARGCRLLVVCAEPSALPALAQALGGVTDGNHLLVHAVSGLLADGLRPSEVLRAHTPVRRLGVLAGPLTVEDLREGRPTAGVLASRHPEVVEELTAALSTPRLRVYRARDMLGAEVATSLVELVALGCGLGEALGFGPATRSLLLVRAVRETGRLIRALGGEEQTASGLAGLGDLLVRGVDPSGEAYRYGLALGRGEAKPAEATGHLAEVQATARRVHQLVRRHRLSAHVFVGLAGLLEGAVSPEQLVQGLMSVPVLDE